MLKSLAKKYLSGIKMPPRRLSDKEFNNKIREKAYELYEKRGRMPGYESADWAEAEKIVIYEYRKK